MNVSQLSSGRKFAALLLILLVGAPMLRAEDEPTQRSLESAAKAPVSDEPDPTDPPSPRELLELYQISASQLDGLADGASILSADEEADLMLRIMYRYPEIPKLLQENWAEQNAVGGSFDWSRLATEPGTHRGEVFSLKGRVVGVTENKLDEAVVERYQIPKFYRVRLELNGSTRIADVYTRTIPKDWEDMKQAGMQSGALAMFLKRGDSADPANPLVFVTDRVAWYRDTLLGDLGVDASLFDNVDSNRRIGAKDRELFYQMLHAAGVAQPNELARYAEREIVIHGRNLIDEQRELRRQLEQLEQQRDAANGAERATLADEVAELKAELKRLELRLKRARQHEHELFPLLEHPDAFKGKLLMFRGVAKQIVKVRVEEPDIVERFGIDHYYQINATVDLEFDVTLKSPNKGEPPREMWSYPVTFCVRKLPPGMPTGDNVGEEIRMAGFFMKKWVYNIGKQPGEEKPERFSAPMLIGHEPIWIKPPPKDNSAANGIMAGTLFVIALLGVWLGVWRFGRGDKKFQRDTLSRNYALEEGVSLNELHLADKGSPDFSYLNEANESAVDADDESSLQPDRDEFDQPARH